MQKTSSLYKRLLADPGHWKEHSLVIGENGVLITKQGDRITFGSKSYTVEAKGSVIQLENVPEAPLRGLTIYGKTTQDGTPSPDNPVPLVSPGDSGSLTVMTSGKNLIDPTDILGFSNTKVSNGVVTQINADTAPLEYLFKVQFLDSDNAFITQYVTYVPAKGRYGVPIEIPKNAALMLFGINGSLVDTMCSIPTSSFTVGAAYTLSVLFTNITQGSVSWQDIQLELGSVATAYEPYKGSTLVLSTHNGLLGIPVTSGGNYTDEDGQQWICDEVDFVRGVYLHNVWRENLVFTPETSASGTRYLGYLTYNSTATHEGAIISDKLPFFKDANTGINGIRASTYNTKLAIAYYNNQVINEATVVYPMEIPIETPLSESELAAYAALHANYPNTTIYNDGGADMVVGYALNGEGPTNILVGSSGADSGFRESSIISMSTQKSIFPDSNPTVGNCISGQISIDMMKPSGNIPRRARISPYVRLSNGKESSEWIQKGVFFIDHREYSGNENDRILINGYDHIILTEDEFPSSTNEWPRMDIDVVRDIANEIGVNVDERTIQIMNKGYKINYPSGYSMREVLENIAAMYAGSFLMSDIGELLLVTMFGIPKETSYLIDNSGFSVTFGGDRILV